MAQTKPAPTTLYCNQNTIEVAAYSFSACNEPARTLTSANVFLDILFQHPRSASAVTLRTIVPAYLLCSSKEEVESAVHRELRNVLRFQTAGIV